jgi:biopolymer transport protein ExbB
MLESVSDPVAAPTFLQSLIKGGWVMVPLAGCSFLSVAIILERLFWGPTRSNVMPRDLQRDAAALLAGGRTEELLGLCRASNSPLARIMLAGLRNASRPRAEIVDAMEVVGRKEAFQLQKHLGFLGTIAAVSPLLGLLGTVFGMISTFHVISLHGTGNPALMADGIAEALIATATGLTVAITSLLFHRFFLQRVRQLVVEMEVLTMSLVDDLQQDQPSLPAGSASKEPLRGSRYT